MVQFIFIIFTGSALLNGLWRWWTGTEDLVEGIGCEEKVVSKKHIVCGLNIQAEMTGRLLETEIAPGEKFRAEASNEIQEPII